MGQKFFVLAATVAMTAACSSSSSSTPAASDADAASDAGSSADATASTTCTGDAPDGGKKSPGFAFGNSIYTAPGGFSTQHVAGSGSGPARGTISMFQQNGACTPAAGTFGQKQPGDAASLTSECAPHCCACPEGPRHAVVSMIVDGKCATEADACATAIKAAPENVDTIPPLANFCGQNCDEP